MNRLADDDVLEVTLYCRCIDQVSATVRHWQVLDSLLEGATDVEVAAGLETALRSDLLECMTEHASYLGIKVQVIRPVRKVAAIKSDNPGIGTWETQPMSLFTAGLIRLRGALATRHDRGRSYIPFPAEGANESEGQPSATYLVALADLATGLSSGYTFGVGGDTSEIIPVIYNRNDHTVRPIESSGVATQWATQRRRSRLRGGDAVPF